MKKIVLIILLLMLLVSFSGCVEHDKVTLTVNKIIVHKSGFFSDGKVEIYHNNSSLPVYFWYDDLKEFDVKEGNTYEFHVYLTEGSETYHVENVVLKRDRNGSKRII